MGFQKPIEFVPGLESEEPSKLRSGELPLPISFKGECFKNAS
jgi:hypothetical protein